MTCKINNFGRMLQRVERKEINDHFFSLVSIRYTNPSIKINTDSKYWEHVNLTLTESLLSSFLTRHTTLTLKTFRILEKKNKNLKLLVNVKGEPDEHNENRSWEMQVGFEVPTLFSNTSWFDPNFVRPGLGFWRVFHKNQRALGVHHFYASLKLAFGRWMHKDSLEQFDREFPPLSK